MRSRVLYYFISTRDFQIGAPAVAGIGAPSVPSRRTRLSLMPVPSGYTNYEKTEIDSESCEVTDLAYELAAHMKPWTRKSPRARRRCRATHVEQMM